MWVGLIIVIALGAVPLAKAFRTRHEQEPQNSRLKLPILLVVLAGCLVLAVTGTQTVFFIVFGGIAAVQIGFVLAGRNPWWMQENKPQRVRYTSLPPRDIDPSSN